MQLKIVKNKDSNKANIESIYHLKKYNKIRNNNSKTNIIKNNLVNIIYHLNKNKKNKLKISKILSKIYKSHLLK